MSPLNIILRDRKNSRYLGATDYGDGDSVGLGNIDENFDCADLGSWGVDGAPRGRSGTNRAGEADDAVESDATSMADSADEAAEANEAADEADNEANRPMIRRG